MSTEQPTTYHVRFLRGQVSTTVSIDGRPTQLVAGADGEVRQIRRGVADPCVDEPIAIALRAMRGWHVEPWPDGYTPDEQVITLNAGEAMPGESQEEAQGRLRRQMLTRLRAIGRTGQIETTDAETEIIALTQTIAELQGRVEAAEAERDSAVMEAAKLRAQIEQQGRIHSPSLPGPGEDRHPPTASELGKGLDLATLRERGLTGEESWPDLETGEGEDDDPAVQGAVAGALQGLGGDPTPAATKRKAAQAARAAREG